MVTCSWMPAAGPVSAKESFSLSVNREEETAHPWFKQVSVCPAEVLPVGIFVEATLNFHDKVR